MGGKGTVMNDDEKMFQIGAWSLGCVLLLSVVLQVCFRTQGRQINRVGNDREIVQQDIAKAKVNFSALVRPENLRSVVTGIYPHAEDVSFNKFVTIDNLPVRDIAQ